ncbi:MAG: hypothetical protein RR855_19720 [Comamonas sp.]
MNANAGRGKALLWYAEQFLRMPLGFQCHMNLKSLLKAHKPLLFLKYTGNKNALQPALEGILLGCHKTPFPPSVISARRRGASRRGLLVGHFQVGFAGFLDEVDQRVDSLAHDRPSFVNFYGEMHFHRGWEWLHLRGHSWG